jgi:virginiamycin B lyase
MLMIAVAIECLGILVVPESVYPQAAVCTPKPNLVADVPRQRRFDTLDNVIASFNYARQQESCNVPLRIDQNTYNAAPLQQKMLLLINAELQDRGLAALKLDATLLSQIALNHAREMSQYNYFQHPSPINQRNESSSARARANPAIRDHWGCCWAENLYNGTLPGGVDSAARAVYSHMYADSGERWGHRQAILGYSAGNPGSYNWIGIGVAAGKAPDEVFYVTDFFRDSLSRPYTRPTTADTQPPSMSPPTIVDGNTVEVTNVQDDPAGRTDGVAGVTGVVFYVGSPIDRNDEFTTVSATQTGNGTWRANLQATDRTTLHAVAVDGSGNYNDCAGNAPSCGAGPSVPRVTEFAVPTAADPLSIAGPISIASGPDGNLWFTEAYANKIGRITPSGVITEFVIPTGESLPYGISSGPDGNLWFTESKANKIGRITPSGVITEFVIPTANSFPCGISNGPDGNLWFTELKANKIGSITTAGTIREFSLPTANSHPCGITGGPDGNVWFTEKVEVVGIANKIGRITPSGAITEFVIPTANSEPLWYGPFGISKGPDGNLWFTEHWANKIGRITPAGSIAEFEIPSVTQTFPSGICSGPDGNLWFTEGTYKIGRITPSGVITEFGGSSGGTNGPLSITNGPDGNLWFTEAYANKIGQITTR